MSKIKIGWSEVDMTPKKGTKIREEKKSKPETKKTENKEITAEDPDQNLTDSIPLTDSETGL